MDESTEPRVRLREYVKRSTPHLWVLCTSFDTVRGLRGPYHHHLRRLDPMFRQTEASLAKTSSCCTFPCITTHPSSPATAPSAGLDGWDTPSWQSARLQQRWGVKGETFSRSRLSFSSLKRTIGSVHMADKEITGCLLSPDV